MNKYRKIQNCIFISAFLLIVMAPICVNLLGLNKQGGSEKRTKAKLPAFSIKAVNDFPQQFEKYFNDNFGLRDALVEGNSYFHVKFLGVSPIDKVVVGKDKWLFYNSKEDGQNISLYRGLNKFNEKELKRIARNLEERKSWLEAQGIPFILMIAPNKTAIYPEYLPGDIRKVQEETQMDQLINYLAANSDVTVLDLRPVFTNNKDKARLYHKTDTHWNDYGAYLAYSKLMEEMSKFYSGFKPHSIEEFTIEFTNKTGGDLANMVSLKNVLPEEDLSLKPRFEISAREMESNVKLTNGVILKTDNSKLPRLLMYRDSFGTALIPFISEHFSESYYNWTHSFDAGLIKELKPDMVVHEIVERHLPALLEDNPAEVR